MKGPGRKKSRKTGENGNALFIILIAVALFALLSYTLTRSGGGKGISQEKASLDSSVAEQCTAYINRGIDMLQLVGGCAASEISYELADGRNSNPSAPVSESCHLFRANGAGLSPCGAWADPESMLTFVGHHYSQAWSTTYTFEDEPIGLSSLSWRLHIMMPISIASRLGEVRQRYTRRQITMVPTGRMLQSHL